MASRFNEGCEATSGPELSRPILCDEARPSSRPARRDASDQPDVHGLAALIDLSAARLAARVNKAGDLILFEDQDRSRWDRQAITNGHAAIERALRAGAPGPMTLQAMIVGCHSAARAWESTDWDAISALHDQLHELARRLVEVGSTAVAPTTTNVAGDGPVHRQAWSGRLDSK